MSNVICVINQKGGCGKSTTCFNLAGHLTEQGMRVLLIDADPQGSLSQAFFGSHFVESLEPQETISEVFAQCGQADIESLVTTTHIENLFIVRSNQHLAEYNQPTPENAGMAQFGFHSLLEKHHGHDVVIIDCPPNLYLCSWNALLVSDFVLVPVPPEDFGTQGLRAVFQSIEHASLLNAKLKLLGMIVTRSDRRLLVHQCYEQRLRELYGLSVFETVIPEASAFKVALACREPVTHYAPRSKAAACTRRLGAEINTRSEKPMTRQEVA